jgi:outer membrane protein assembly factor BamB
MFTKRPWLLALAAVAGTALAGGADAPKGSDKNWHQWRGPYATGAAPFGNPPVEWSETKNVKWKAAIPGSGSATPVVWGDTLYVLSAVPTDKRAAGAVSPAPAAGAGGPRRGAPRGPQPEFIQQFTVLAINRKDGKILWQKVLKEELPHEGTHPTNTWASGSAVTDGEMMYAYFGSRGLYALDMKGNLKWQTDFGDMTTRNGFGEGTTPALYGDKLVVLWDHEGDDFIVALHKKTGKELWRTPRQEATTWTTPLVVEVNGKAQVIVAATSRVISYDLETGSVVWEGPGLTPNSIPSPVYADGIVYLTSGFRGNVLYAVRLAEAKGDITGTPAILWKYDRDTPYVPSPLLYGNELYFLKSNNGILTVFNAKTGEKLYGEQRIEEVPNVYASPVGAGGKVYIAGREGSTAVIERGATFKLLSVNKLDDGFDASPVVVGDELYLRGKKNLYCIAAQ